MNRLKVCVDRETQLARASIGIRTVTMTNAAIKHSDRSATRTSAQQLHVVWAAVGTVGAKYVLYVCLALPLNNHQNHRLQ